MAATKRSTLAENPLKFGRIECMDLTGSEPLLFAWPCADENIDWSL